MSTGDQRAAHRLASAREKRPCSREICPRNNPERAMSSLRMGCLSWKGFYLTCPGSSPSERDELCEKGGPEPLIPGPRERFQMAGRPGRARGGLSGEAWLGLRAGCRHPRPHSGTSGLLLAESPGRIRFPPKPFSASVGLGTFGPVTQSRWM